MKNPKNKKRIAIKAHMGPSEGQLSDSEIKKQIMFMPIMIEKIIATFVRVLP